MTLIRKTSYSEVTTFLRCGREHFYSYGLNLQGKYQSEALERGIIAHATLAEYYGQRMAGLGHDEASALAFEQLARVGADTEAYLGQKLVFEVADLLRLYFANYANDPIEVLAVETEYSVAILDDYELPVRIDLIVRNLETGRVEVWDHKVVKDFYDEAKVRITPQLRLYKAGLDTAGIQVDDLVYNQLRHRATIDNKADPSLRFVRMPVPVNASSVRRTIEEHLIAANRIAAWRKMDLDKWDERVLRNHSACGMCSFKLLCAQDLEGEDTTNLKEFEYQQKTPRAEMNA